MASGQSEERFCISALVARRIQRRQRHRKQPHNDLNESVGTAAPLHETLPVCEDAHTPPTVRKRRAPAPLSSRLQKQKQRQKQKQASGWATPHLSTNRAHLEALQTVNKSDPTIAAECDLFSQEIALGLERLKDKSRRLAIRDVNEVLSKYLCEEPQCSASDPGSSCSGRQPTLHVPPQSAIPDTPCFSSTTSHPQAH